MELKESAGNVTMHGFGRISATKSRELRIIWLILIFGFVSLLIFHMVSILTRFYSNPSITKYETVIASSLQFPSVTICGPSYSKYKLEKFAENRNISFKPEENEIGLGWSKFVYAGYILKHLGTAENRLSVAPDEDTFLMKNLSESCMVGEEKECSYEDFQKIPISYGGYCYRLNPNGTFIQTRPGPSQAISVILFLNVSDSMPWSQADAGDSVEVILQHHKEYPFHAFGSFFAPVGYISQIEIGKTEIERLAAPYRSNCTIGEDVTLLFPGEYTTINCRESCFALEMAKKCNSVDIQTKFFLPPTMKTPVSRNKDDVDCIMQTYENLKKTGFASCNCELPCFETKFQKTISYSRWPSIADLPIYKMLFSKALGMNQSAMTDQFVRSNFVKINVFYGDMAYQKLSETKEYTLDKLISEIGGQMGIWIGASVFSLIEVIYLLGQCLHHACAAKPKNTREMTLKNVNVDH